MGSLGVMGGEEGITESPVAHVYQLLLDRGFERADSFRTPGFREGLVNGDVEISSLSAPGHDNIANIYISLPICVDRFFPCPPGFFFRFLGGSFGYLGARFEVDVSCEIAEQISDILHAVAEGNRLISHNRHRLIQYMM